MKLELIRTLKAWRGLAKVVRVDTDGISARDSQAVSEGEGLAHAIAAWQRSQTFRGHSRSMQGRSITMKNAAQKNTAYSVLGISALAYTTRITFAGPHLPELYGDGNLRATYRLALRGQMPNRADEINPDVPYLFHGFEPRATSR